MVDDTEVKLFVVTTQYGFELVPAHALARRGGTLAFTNLTQHPVEVTFPDKCFSPTRLVVKPGPERSRSVHIKANARQDFYAYKALVTGAGVQAKGRSSPGVIIQG